jgi:hypothetical protein
MLSHRASSGRIVGQKWAPLYIGGVLSVIAKVAVQSLAVEIAGASLGIQVIQKMLERADHPVRRVFLTC